MGETKAIQKRNHAFTAETRDMLIKAGVAEDMLAAFQGQPLPIRDVAGRVTGQTDVPALSDRIAIGKVLLAKILPDLRAVELSGDVGVDGTVTYQLASGIIAPGSLKNVEDAEVVEPEQIEDATPVTAIEPDPEPVPTRKRRPRRGEPA